MPLEVVVEYLVSTFFAMLIWWLGQDQPYPPEQMDAMFKQPALPGLMATLDMAANPAPSR